MRDEKGTPVRRTYALAPCTAGGLNCQLGGCTRNCEPGGASRLYDDSRHCASSTGRHGLESATHCMKRRCDATLRSVTRPWQRIARRRLRLTGVSACPVSQETCLRCDSPTYLRDERMVACTTLPPARRAGMAYRLVWRQRTLPIVCITSIQPTPGCDADQTATQSCVQRKSLGSDQGFILIG